MDQWYRWCDWCWRKCECCCIVCWVICVCLFTEFFWWIDWEHDKSMQNKTEHTQTNKNKQRTSKNAGNTILVLVVDIWENDKYDIRQWYSSVRQMRRRRRKWMWSFRTQIQWHMNNKYQCICVMMMSYNNHVIWRSSKNKECREIKTKCKQTNRAVPLSRGFEPSSYNEQGREQAVSRIHNGHPQPIQSLGQRPQHIGCIWVLAAGDSQMNDIRAQVMYYRGLIAWVTICAVTSGTETM